MFGYVRPLVAEMKVKEHTAYLAVYCGLCHATGAGGCGDGRLGGCFGGGSARLALRYDTVFLALTRMLIDGEPVQVRPRRCLLHPVKPRPTVEPCNALRDSANAGALLFAHSLIDHAADEGGAARMLIPYASHLRRVFSGKLRGDRVRVTDGKTDLDASMEAHLTALRGLEQDREPSADRVADVFGRLLGEVFAYGYEGEVSEYASRIGYHLGRWIYFADALDDLPGDERRGRYNPLLIARKQGEFDPARLQSAMLLDLMSAHRALDAIKGGDAGARAILCNMLELGMVQTTDHLIRACLPPPPEPGSGSDPDSGSAPTFPSSPTDQRKDPS